MYDMDEEAARILSQALIQSSSLRKLVLREVKGEASAFLLKALDGDGGNRAIECLHLSFVSELGDCLRDLLRSNRYLKEVTLIAIDMRPEEWSQLGHALRDNATERTIRVGHLIHHKDDLKGVEELVCAASSDDKDPKVELIITFYDYDALISALNFVEVSGTSWETDGKSALIQEALEQNQKRAVYMAEFREARLAFGDAKAGRLFLCGSPLAGEF
ncbi:hypothetical protein AXG93_4491s1210 [Marchantia polymorpha subsp. ruderalis]|uniref:FBD domain-containing protein n=1 Tax=Marchantia polymorpha subsp. ruderalis TaxID=1480154 RepID=A0A176WRV8_MARPO|nr:hypothetical protein AXG93_4491s1210 [Marchantia polymorpha subsp. ruderalis]